MFIYSELVQILNLNLNQTEREKEDSGPGKENYENLKKQKKQGELQGLEITLIPKINKSPVLVNYPAPSKYKYLSLKINR